jgi:hypothetical protein
MAPTPQADAVPVCIATTMADVISIELCSLRAKPARSVSSGAMDAVARMSETIHSSQRGPMLRADVDENVLITLGVDHLALDDLLLFADQAPQLARRTYL